VLRSANLVKYRKAGKVLYYSLSDDHVQKIINEGMEHVVE
jgi:ArsR family transcriptional regulator